MVSKCRGPDSLSCRGIETSRTACGPSVALACGMLLLACSGGHPQVVASAELTDGIAGLDGPREQDWTAAADVEGPRETLAHEASQPDADSRVEVNLHEYPGLVDVGLDLAEPEAVDLTYAPEHSPPEAAGQDTGFPEDLGPSAVCSPSCDPLLEHCGYAISGSPVCSPAEVEVPAGPAWVGCNWFADEALCTCSNQGPLDDWSQCPYHGVTTGSYFIDSTEVTAGQYSVCVAEGACDPVADDDCSGTAKDTNFGKPGKGSFPMNCVDWLQARAYCQWKCDGCRLCSEAEWEKAARGGCAKFFDCMTTSPMYPWGDEKPESCGDELAAYLECNCAEETAIAPKPNGTCAVGTHPAGRSPYGVHDMIGNVAEWTEDAYSDSYYGAPVDGSPRVDADATGRVIRGGGYSSLYYSYPPVVSVRWWGDPSFGSAAQGFRCCRTP